MDCAISAAVRLISSSKLMEYDKVAQSDQKRFYMDTLDLFSSYKAQYLRQITSHLPLL